ncbi:MAG: hypothetical protein J6I96_02650 [Oscillospiraceae bacterium]|nr:hypothetical protein [Oscillospiraceae bacterium]
MIFLIDYENVTSAGLDGVERLTENDRVYIFYTAAQSNLSFEAHKAILSSKAAFSYFNVANGGKNALDFQLASFTGYLVGRSEDRQIYIISGDKSFSFIWRFWENADVERVNIYTAQSVTKALMRTVTSDAVRIGDVAAQTAPATEQAAVTDAAPTEEKASVPTEIPAAEPVVEEKSAVEAPKKRQSKEKNGRGSVTADIKRYLTEAEIDVSKCGMVVNLLANAADKQQFYTGMTKAFGMDKGLAVYKVLRADYTNLKRMVDEK